MKRDMFFLVPVMIVMLLSWPAFGEDDICVDGEKWKKDFPDKILSVILDVPGSGLETVANGGGIEGIPEGMHPRVIITDKGLRFFDEHGRQNKFVSYDTLATASWVQYAKSAGRYIGVHSMEGGPVVRPKARYAMLNDAGDIIWETDVSAVGYGNFFPSPDGSYVVATGDFTGDFSDCMPSVWDRDGLRKKIQGGCGNMFLRCGFDATGDRFIASSREPTAVALFKRDGSMIWENSYVDWDSIRAEQVSRSGDSSAALLGKSVAEAVDPLKRDRHDNAGQKPRFLDYEEYLILFDSTGRERWRQKVPRMDGKMEIRFNEAGSVVTLLGKNRTGVILDQASFDARTGRQMGRGDVSGRQN